MPQPSVLPVALFLSRFVPGGTENQMIELASRLDRSRFEVHIACFDRSGPWLQRAEAVATSIAEFPVEGFARLATLRQMRRFARWCRETRIAIVHTTDLYANIIGLPAAWCAGVPVRIANRREINPDKSLGLIALQRAAYGFASTIAANSQAAAERLVRERVGREAVVVIPNGLDVAAFPPRAPRERLRRIITVANLRTEKAHEVLIDAAGAVLRRHPDAQFLIAGGGVRLDELITLARGRGLGERMQFLGHRDDVPALLADSDIFVLPSRSEASPSSVVEAMAAGLPVVATAVGGIPELIEHQRNGFLVPPDDPQGVASALLDLMESPARAAAIGRAARESVEHRFSFERMVSAFENLYSSEFDAASPLVPCAASQAN